MLQINFEDLQRAQREIEQLRCVIEDLCNNREVEIFDAIKAFAKQLVEKAKFFSIDSEGDFIDSEIDKYEIHDSFADSTIYLCEHVIEEWVGDEV